jgi:hypothetical protein
MDSTMTLRTAAFALFFPCAAALIFLVLWNTGGMAPAAGGAGPAPVAEKKDSRAPAFLPASPVAPGAVPSAPAKPPAAPSDPTARAGSEADAIPPVPESTRADPLLTDEEKARGVSLIPGGGRVDFKNKTLILPAEVSIQSGALELFACADGGKDHESILRVRCRPELVNLNLTLFNLKKGPSRPRPGVPAGDRVIILCEWTEDGKTVSVRAEDMIWDEATKRPMDRVGWTYVGSEFLPDYDVETGKPTGRQIFAATYGRTLVATFEDPHALLETPLPEGVDDSMFTANAKAIPPRSTAVRMIIRPPTPEETEEIRLIESRIEEQRKGIKRRGQRREDSGDNPKPAPPPEDKKP